LEHLVRERFAVVFCDSTLEDGSWKDVLAQVGTGAGATPLIVTSRLADATLWSEVLNLGGYDVLAKPFLKRDVIHVLTTISLEWDRRFRLPTGSPTAC
jgi:DNA-binding NtrC family response regulator